MKRIKFFQFVFFLFLFILIPSYASPLVEIKGISDNTIPEIIAVVNIINIDLEDHLYKYEYCILSDMLSSCDNSIDSCHLYIYNTIQLLYTVVFTYKFYSCSFRIPACLQIYNL